MVVKAVASNIPAGERADNKEVTANLCLNLSTVESSTNTLHFHPVLHMHTREHGCAEAIETGEADAREGERGREMWGLRGSLQAAESNLHSDCMARQAQLLRSTDVLNRT